MNRIVQFERDTSGYNEFGASCSSDPLPFLTNLTEVANLLVTLSPRLSLIWPAGLGKLCSNLVASLKFPINARRIKQFYKPTTAKGGKPSSPIVFFSQLD